MTKQVICNSCRAQFDNDEPKCPYYGTMNYDGAEKEYLEKLEDVREDMEEAYEEMGDFQFVREKIHEKLGL